VTTSLYGGDLYSLKGTVRNVSHQPRRNVLVVWLLYGPDGQPFVVRGAAPDAPSAFLARIEYLEANAEAEFEITIDLRGPSPFIWGGRRPRNWFRPARDGTLREWA